MTSGRQSARQRNVLLVGDNPVDQRIAVRLLIRRGHCVTLANNESTPSSEEAGPARAPTASALDVGQMRDRVGDDELIADIVRLFLEDHPIRHAAIERAVEERDPERICSGAHTLKGSASNLSASRVAAAAHMIEALGDPADFSGVDANLMTLVAEVERLAAALRQFQAGTSRCGR
jgi:HPt (histidine-containing phosphotransfer) domain-containing protein